jgi:hypothetical protein
MAKDGIYHLVVILSISLFVWTGVAVSPTT